MTTPIDVLRERAQMARNTRDRFIMEAENYEKEAAVARGLAGQHDDMAAACASAADQLEKTDGTE